MPDGGIASITEEFLEFIEQSRHSSVKGVASAVLLKCRRITNAEAGSIFIVRGAGGSRRLEALSLQNDAIRAESSLFVIPVTGTSIAGYVALTGEIVMVPDVENIPSHYPFKFNRAFDLKSGYKTRSVMCFALRTAEGRIVGVVQLINALGPPDILGTRPVIPFDEKTRGFVGPVNLIVSRLIERTDALEKIALRNQQLRAERQKVIEQSHETERAFMMSVELLARAAEVHDEGTGNHILRVNEYSHLLANLAKQPKWMCKQIRWAAALHDVGKMSVDIAVLKKPGRLNEAEWAEMRNHTVYGHAILEREPRMAMAAEIAFCHHETWAGTGYPRRLKGDRIPISARIVAIADVYDALRSERPYKPAFSHEKATKIITEGDDRIDPKIHFDPKLLELFEKHNSKFGDIWDHLSKDELHRDGSEPK